MTTATLELPSLEATEALGRRLASLLFPGAVVALVGQLGAGKTQLTRAIAEALGVPAGVVTSPTFVLIQEYQGQLPVYHFDAYRLNSPDEFSDLGPHEYFAGDGVCLVEWADRVESCLPAERLTLELVATGPDSRQVRLCGRGSRYEAIVEQLVQDYRNDRG